MTIQIALLRGVNVGGHQAVAMSELRNLATEFGFGGARSILQSGNLIFRCDARTGVDLENLLEREAEKRLGFHADFFIRSAKEWREVVAAIHFGRTRSATLAIWW